MDCCDSFNECNCDKTNFVQQFPGNMKAQGFGNCNCSEPKKDHKCSFIMDELKNSHTVLQYIDDAQNISTRTPEHPVQMLRIETCNGFADFEVVPKPCETSCCGPNKVDPKKSADSLKVKRMTNNFVVEEKCGITTITQLPNHLNKCVRTVCFKSSEDKHKRNKW